ncbi:hypothetical protein B0J12DRAFT_654054 [Macrophomina phaseolina]|uniref:C6 transcription factor n=1 Tax=Macrophomina phaseolina TaxID=35725 RepID=A0ABQ8GJ92_9PEZI|nr:hypothetical protein B0J12DRAFT_654054 [Macrophomina phaseolina]
MELFHHYVFSTSATFSFQSRTIEKRRQATMGTAFTDPPVMHSILAITALHRAHLASELATRRHYVTVATMHQDMVIRDLRKRVEQITSSNAPGAFLISSYLALFTLGSMHQLDSAGPDAAATLNLESPADWIRLMRGVPKLLMQDSVLQWVLHSPVGVFFKDERQNWTLPLELEPRFSLLGEGLSDSSLVESLEERTTYVAALKLLKHWTANAYAPNEETDLVGTALIWVNIVDDQYVEYLCADRPGALVLLAQWAVLLNRLEGLWWAAGWGKGLMAIALKRLPETWKPFIQEQAREMNAWPAS